MPCNKVRKTDRGNFESDIMRAAVLAVTEENLSIRKVAKDFGLSRTTLTRYVNERKQAQDPDVVCYKKSHVTKQVFGHEDEKLFVDYIIESSKMFHGLSVKAARQLAYRYAKRNGKIYPASWDENNEAGIDWFYGLMSRHNNLRVRMPEATSIVRAVAFNKYNVNLFFDKLEDILSRDNMKLDPNRLWNLDETGIRTVPSATRVLAEKGFKQVGLLTSAERGSLVTICACVNAAGNALPPVYIFPRVHFKDHMLNGAPNGSKGFATMSGWMNRELFPQVLEHFMNLMNISKENPGILVMDNHDSHTTIDVIDLARDNGLIILTFPPHCSHRMQPLDVSVFGPFKVYYNRACTDHLLSNHGKSLSIYDLALISSTAFYKAFTIENVQAGFRKSGLFPVNRNVFPEDAFLSSKPFDRPQPQDNERQPGPSNGQGTEIVAPTVSPGPTSPNPTLQNTGIVSPQEIRPFPTAAPRDPATKKRASKKSSIITDTPERLQVLEKSKRVMKPKEGAVARRKLMVSSESEEEQSGNEEDTDSELEEPERDPVCGDFVLIQYTRGKENVHYVGDITKEEDEEGDIEVHFLSRLNKTDNFFFTDEMCSVNFASIVKVLPAPQKVDAQTKQQKTSLKFDFCFDFYSVN